VRAGVANLEAIFTMNAIGAAIWTRIDGKTSVGELARAVTEEFEVGQDEASTDVAAFVALLATKGLVVDAGVSP
jgi:hypothetical protein